MTATLPHDYVALLKGERPPRTVERSMFQSDRAPELERIEDICSYDTPEQVAALIAGA